MIAEGGHCLGSCMFCYRKLCGSTTPLRVWDLMRILSSQPQRLRGVRRGFRLANC